MTPTKKVLNTKDESAEFQAAIKEYKNQLAKGTIKTAYMGLMRHLEGLRASLEKNHPDFYVSSTVESGRLDFSYFYFTPQTLKQKKLKIVILFVHDSFRFEVWLAGYNKAVQAKYWKQLKESNLKYRMPASVDGSDSIVELTLVDNADFNDSDALTKKIEEGSLKFIADIENLLSNSQC
jgi:hypothetical protein